MTEYEANIASVTKYSERAKKDDLLRVSHTQMDNSVCVWVCVCVV